MLQEVNSVCNIHSEVNQPLRRVHTPVEQLQPFEWSYIVDLHEFGWTHRRFAAHVGHSVLVVCRCFQQWSVQHSHTCRPGSGWPRSTDILQDGHIVQAVVAAWTASSKKIQAHVGTCCVTKEHWESSAYSRARVTSASGQATTYTMTPSSTAALVLSCLLCLYASVGCTHVWHRPGEYHLAECICARHIGFMVCGGISYKSWSHLVFL